MFSSLTWILLFTTELIGWPELADTEFELKYVEQFGERVQIPVFGPSLMQLEGQTFELSGYYVPTEMESETMILSKMPYASCFFCGGAGIESVVEVQLADGPQLFELDQIVTVSGILELNSTDFEHLIYIIKQARVIRS